MEKLTIIKCLTVDGLRDIENAWRNTINSKYPESETMIKIIKSPDELYMDVITNKRRLCFKVQA